MCCVHTNRSYKFSLHLVSMPGEVERRQMLLDELSTKERQLEQALKPDDPLSGRYVNSRILTDLCSLCACVCGGYVYVCMGGGRNANVDQLGLVTVVSGVPCSSKEDLVLVRPRLRVRIRSTTLQMTSHSMKSDNNNGKSFEVETPSQLPCVAFSLDHLSRVPSKIHRYLSCSRARRGFGGAVTRHLPTKGARR